MQASGKISETEIMYVARKIRDELLDLFRVNPDEFWNDEYENMRYEAGDFLTRQLKELTKNGR